MSSVKLSNSYKLSEEDWSLGSQRRESPIRKTKQQRPKYRLPDSSECASSEDEQISPQKHKEPVRDSDWHELSSEDSITDCSDICDELLALKLDSPTKSAKVYQPKELLVITPPSSPSKATSISPNKSRLQSPSKNRTKLPTPPGRPSLDAFWDAHYINSWHDQHSPPKRIQSPSKLQLSHKAVPDIGPKDTSTDVFSLSHSPQKSKADIATRNAFDKVKINLAESFLVDLDTVVCHGKITEATSTTGGVKIVWSKTLNSTAGRATWKREKIKPKPRLDPNTSSLDKQQESQATTYIHHATIELATKVITDEQRLYNTLAHEFCHLATYILSGIKTNPHGAEFKSWGGKCTTAFRSKGVNVTTKHDYEIDFRYIWLCTGPLNSVIDASSTSVSPQPAIIEGGGGCGKTYGRHSKSIDPIKQGCGHCKGRLVQIKPAVRMNVSTKNGSKSPVKEVNGFAAYMKENFARVKRDLGPKQSQKSVMEEMGRQYRAEKERKNTKDQLGDTMTTETDSIRMTKDMEDEDDKAVDVIAKELDVILIDD